MAEKVYPFTETGIVPRLKKFPTEHEYEWGIVCRERKEGQAKFLGGNYREVVKEKK